MRNPLSGRPDPIDRSPRPERYLRKNHTVREVVERVLGAETEAKTRIDEAKKRAAMVRSQADEAATAAVSSAREKAVSDARSRLERARSEADAMLEKARAEDAAADKAFAASAEVATDALIIDIVARIAGRPS